MVLFFSACNYNKAATTDLAVVTPTASSSPCLHKTEKPAYMQKTTSHYMTSNATFNKAESRSETSNEYITFAVAPELDPTTKVPTTTTTTSTSKIIRGKIPWNKLFGNKGRERMLSRLKKPLTANKTSTTTETRGTLTTTIAPTPITSANLLDFIPVTSYSGSSQFYTTAETPPELQTLPSPPTVKPTQQENLDVTSSGSGRLSDNLLIIRQRPGETRGRLGRRRRPNRRRRPLRKPGIPKVRQTTTTEAITTEATTMEYTMEATTLFQQSVSEYNPIYTQKDARTTVLGTTEKRSEESDLYEDFDWTSSGSSSYPTTMTPLFSSATYDPATTLIPHTTKRFYTTAQTRFHSNIKPPTQRNGDTNRSLVLERIRPTGTRKSSGTKGSVDNSDTLILLTAQQGYMISTPVPYIPDKDSATSTIYNQVSGYDATSASNAGFEPTTKVMSSKPKIVGGNAASFTVLSNSDAFLPCVAVGNPQPVITWKRFSSSTGTKMISFILIISRTKM